MFFHWLNDGLQKKREKTTELATTRLVGDIAILIEEAPSSLFFVSEVYLCGAIERSAQKCANIVS